MASKFRRWKLRLNYCNQYKDEMVENYLKMFFTPPTKYFSRHSKIALIIGFGVERTIFERDFKVLF